MILEAMREAGAEPGDTMMIGDTTYDIEMARAAGVTSVGVTWGYHQGGCAAGRAAPIMWSATPRNWPHPLTVYSLRRKPPEAAAGHVMRDIFEDIFKNDPLDPMEAARRHARPTLRKRFYKTAGVTQNGDLFEVTLDGKPVRTPSRRPLATPSRDLSQAIADEWQAQTDMIDPANMPLDAPRPIPSSMVSPMRRNWCAMRSSNISAPIFCSIVPTGRSD